MTLRLLSSLWLLYNILFYVIIYMHAYNIAILLQTVNLIWSFRTDDNTQAAHTSRGTLLGVNLQASTSNSEHHSLHAT